MQKTGDLFMEIARVRVVDINQVRAFVRHALADHDFPRPLSSSFPGIRAFYPACSPTGFPPTLSRQPGKHVENMPFLVYMFLFVDKRDSYTGKQTFSDLEPTGPHWLYQASQLLQADPLDFRYSCKVLRTR